MAQLLSVNSGLVAGLSGRRWGRKLDSADRPNVAPEEFKRQENKQAFWSQRAHSLSLSLSFFLSFFHSLSPPSPLLILASFSSPDLYFFYPPLKTSPCVFLPSIFFSILSANPGPRDESCRETDLHKEKTDASSDQPGGRQTDRHRETQTRASLFH